MKRTLPFFLALAILFFQGCASKPVSVPLSERIQQKISEQDGTALKTGPGQGRDGRILEEELARSEEERRRRAAEQEAMQAAVLKDIYFEFDSYTIKADYLPVLKEIAGWLNRNQSVRLAVEGHCDERGTTDYNLALGQKRAEAVKDYLTRLGVGDKRIKAVSYGKEAPADASHTEEAWAKNRRAHFTVEK